MKTLIFLALTLEAILFLGCQQVDPVQQAKVNLKPAIDAYLYAWNTGAVDTLDAVCDRALVRYEWATTSMISLDSLKSAIRTERFTFSDLKMAVDEEFYVGNHAIIRFTETGKHTGAGSIPATGKSITMSGISIFRFTGNKITEVRSGSDHFGVFHQLGFKLVPPVK